MEAVEQIFLFVRTKNGLRQAEITAATDRIPSCDLAELTEWFSGPEKDVLVRFDRLCLFFHPLPSGRFALGILFPCDDGLLGSLKKPDSFFVRILVVPPKTLLFKGNNPVFLYHELNGEGRLPLVEKAPEKLFPLPVSESRQILNQDLLRRLTAESGTVAAVVAAEQSLCDELCLFALRPQNISMLHFIEGLIDLLPIRYRTELSFSTELFFSAKNPFRLIGLSESRSKATRLSLESGIPLLDLNRCQKTNSSSCPATFDPWPQFVFQVLENARFANLERILETELDQLCFSPEDEISCFLDWNDLHEIALRWGEAIREEKNVDKNLVSLAPKRLPEDLRFHSAHPIKEILRCSAAFDRVLPLLEQKNQGFDLNRETVASIISNFKTKYIPNSARQFVSVIEDGRTENDSRFRLNIEQFDVSAKRLFAGENFDLEEIQERWKELQGQCSWEQLEEIRETYLARIHTAVADSLENREEKTDRNIRFLELMLLLLNQQTENRIRA